MELGDELTPIVFWHAHECATHNDELDLYTRALGEGNCARKERTLSTL
jgi:hypothetical protein